MATQKKKSRLSPSDLDFSDVTWDKVMEMAKISPVGKTAQR